MKVAAQGDPKDVQAFVAWLLMSDSPLDITNLTTEGDSPMVIQMDVRIDDEKAWFIRQAGAGHIDAKTLRTRLAQIDEAKRLGIKPEDVSPTGLGT